MSAEAVVREAIEARRSLFLVYRAGATRVVQPHALYRTSGGRLFLDAYQVAGASSSGELPGWREFDLALTTELEPLDDAFEVAPGFDPGALKYRRGVVAIVR
jgi:WYL domain